MYIRFVMHNLHDRRGNDSLDQSLQNGQFLWRKHDGGALLVSSLLLNPFSDSGGLDRCRLPRIC